MARSDDRQQSRSAKRQKATSWKRRRGEGQEEEWLVKGFAAFAGLLSLFLLRAFLGSIFRRIAPGTRAYTQKLGKGGGGRDFTQVIVEPLRFLSQNSHSSEPNLLHISMISAASGLGPSLNPLPIQPVLAKYERSSTEEMLLVYDSQLGARRLSLVMERRRRLLPGERATKSECFWLAKAKQGSNRV